MIGCVLVIKVCHETDCHIRDLTVLDKAWSVVHRGNLSYPNILLIFPVYFAYLVEKMTKLHPHFMFDFIILEVGGGS